MNIAVYCGSSAGADPAFAEAARALGTWIGRAGHRLVYGGSSTGIMGVLADAVLAAGGEVTGVMPRFLSALEIVHPGLTRFEETETMAERKTRMLELADAYVALPGGVGTLEEVSEVMSLCRVGQLAGRCVLLNLHGYWEPLRAQLHAMAGQGFILPEELSLFRFAEDLPALQKALTE